MRCYRTGDVFERPEGSNPSSSAMTKPTGNPKGRPPGSIPGMSSDMKLLSQLHRTQARLYRMQQRQLERRMKKGYEADALWEMSDEDRLRLMEINKFLGETSTSMVRVSDAAIKATQGLTLEQLKAQAKAEFIRAAWSFTGEEWRILDEIRAKRAQKEPSA